MTNIGPGTAGPGTAGPGTGRTGTAGPDAPVLDGRILERGYRHYEGTRLGTGHAMKAMARHTFQRIMGLRRGGRAKVLPFAAVIIAYLPAISFIGLLALVGDAQRRSTFAFLRPPSGYYGYVTAAILLLVTFVAPEALCPDRRWRSLSLYLASPLDRRTYLVAKAGAIAGAISLVSLGPVLLYAIGRAVQNAGPHGLGGFVAEEVRIVAAGVFLAVCFTAISMAISSLTDRRGLAIGGTLLLLLGSRFVFGVLFYGFKIGPLVKLVDLAAGPYEVVQRIFGEPGEVPGLPTAVLFGWYALLITGCGAFVMNRYRKLLVTR